MKLFYRLKNQRAQGPFSIEEMIHWVRTEELNILDPIFREGDEKWRPLNEFPEFRAVLKEIKTKREQDSWVLLVKKDPAKKGGWIQKGPFSTEQVREMIQQGDVFYTDHIWKKGMTEWKKISAIEAFNPPTPIWDLPPPPQVFPAVKVEAPNEDLLKNVIRKTPVPVSEPKPPEAAGEDLASQTIVAPTPPQQIHITVNQPAATAPTSKKVEPENTHVRVRISEDDESSNWWIHTIVITIVLGFAGYYLMMSSKPDVDSEVKAPPVVVTKPQPPEPEIEPELPPPPQPEPPPQATVPEPHVSRAVRAPHVLKIDTGGRRNGKVVIKSDASPHFDLQIELMGSFGDVVGKRSEWRKKVFPRVSFPYDLDLSHLVSPGLYALTVELGDKTAKQKVWVNSSGKDLKPALQRHIKQNVFGFINEKRRLVRLLKKWQDAGQPEPLHEVTEFNRKNRADLYYVPQFWMEAYELSRKPKGPQWVKAVQKLRSEVIYSHPYTTTRAR